MLSAVMSFAVITLIRVDEHCRIEKARRRLPPARKEAASGGVSIEDVRAVKELADRLGPAKVRALIDVLYQ
jgi:hypothetical protein